MYNTLSSKISNKYIFTAKNKRKKASKTGEQEKGGEASERQNYIHKIFLSLA